MATSKQIAAYDLKVLANRILRMPDDEIKKELKRIEKMMFSKDNNNDKDNG
ncbi:MAG: hypothetical protein LBL00_03830 [Endomicrobium sp.]|jgi:hypothetical protein|nr:hypothetical protein [Endomicrobium sp.]